MKFAQNVSWKSILSQLFSLERATLVMAFRQFFSDTTELSKTLK